MTEEQILQKVEEVSAAMIESIRQMVQIDSTEAPAEPGAPFGPGVRKALDAALALSDKLGFETVDVDHYMGYAAYGRGDDYIAAVGTWMWFRQERAGSSRRLAAMRRTA